jgi:hypothetical protein
MFWKSMPNKFCCAALSSLLDCAGDSGMSMIVTEQDSGGFRFQIQSRGVSYKDQGALAARKPNIDILINLKMSIFVKRCPFCGFALAKLAMRAPEYYRDLAMQHKIFDEG